jgi:parallel beta-helix repeat protein
VSGREGFLSALNSADGSDTIVLKSGNYGSVELSSSQLSNVTITSASASNPAVFKSFSAKGASNLTIDRISFVGSSSGGYGDGTGLKLSKGSNVTIEDSTFSTYAKGIQVWGTSNVKVIDNTLKNISHDGMVMGHTNGALIQDNDINMNARPGSDHKDNIQFYNEGPLAPASDITIRGNSLSSADGVTHGIFMGNADARSGDKLSEYYENVLIENNSVATGHRLGISVGQADGVTIRGNRVLQHEDMNSSKTINKPVILVHEDSRDVVITGNVVLDAPSAASGAWGDESSGSGWSISSNKLVSLGTTSGSSSSAPPPEPASPDSDTPGSGTANDFRFNNGDEISGKQRTVFNDVSFDEGDRIILNKFDAGTFNDVGGGNIVENNAEETYVRIDSLADIREIDAASKDVSALSQADGTLVLRVEQDQGTLDIVLPGLADLL